MMSWILAAAVTGSAAASAASTKAANRADKDAARIGEYQDQMEKSQIQQQAQVSIQNMITDLGALESGQVATAAAQGKRSSGGSQAAIQKHQRGLLSRDIADIERAADQSGKLLDLQTTSRYSKSAATQRARNLSWLANTASSASKLIGK